WQHRQARWGDAMVDSKMVRSILAARDHLAGGLCQDLRGGAIQSADCGRMPCGVRDGRGIVDDHDAVREVAVEKQIHGIHYQWQGAATTSPKDPPDHGAGCEESPWPAQRPV